MHKFQHTNSLIPNSQCPIPKVRFRFVLPATRVCLYSSSGLLILKYHNMCQTKFSIYRIRILRFLNAPIFRRLFDRLHHCDINLKQFTRLYQYPIYSLVRKFPRALTIRPKILVWISGNFHGRMVQNFPVDCTGVENDKPVPFAVLPSKIENGRLSGIFVRLRNIQ